MRRRRTIAGGTIGNAVNAAVYSLLRPDNYSCALKGSIEKVLYRTMFMFLTNLGIMSIGVVRVNRVGMWVQFQYKRIGHHYSGKEQEH
ncbi:hypothetical protein H7F15_01900 [Pontibacter sp. Tf4]|uniref:hypothetical protein n=1 Tax=Pontibacter sp. Tf4 TaxID=2761620 RepID=UPI001625D7E6|nr:hypothetical protein [Pontibacter sp. Tf4]MBB6609779.1 hypothetical protein [Pontibacter sp. Tf4]